MARSERRVDGRELERRVRIAAAAAVNIALEEVLAMSQQLVPLEEGTLQASGHVVPATPEDPRGEVRYSTAYAAKQHEELDYQHLPGRTAKYLEGPFKARLPEIRKLVGEAVTRTVRVSR